MTHLSKPVEHTPPEVDRNINSGLGMVMMCQWSSAYCKKGPTVVGGVDDGGGCACVYSGNQCTFCSILL